MTGIRLCAVLVLIGLTLSACGKKGPVRPLSGPLPVNSVTGEQQPPAPCCQ